MHLQTINHLIHSADTPRPGDLPISHYAVASDTRLAILLHLHNRPFGATSVDLADLLNLDVETVRGALKKLALAQRVACDSAGSKSRWYSPLARAKAARVDEAAQ